jgi:four helix bundle protein
MNIDTNTQLDHAILAHEKLDGYQLALQFLEVAELLVRRLPRTKGQLGDQLARASEGVVLRIAEGTGAEWRSAEQKRYFRSARGSALECAAVLDICRVRNIGSAEGLQQGRRLLVRIIQVLSRLSRAG